MTNGFFLLVASFIFPGSVQDAAPIAASDYLPLKVGTEWHYKTQAGKFVNRVVSHEKLADVMCARIETFSEKNSNQSVANEHVTITKEGAIRIATAGQKPEPPLLLLKLPPRMGDEWKIDAKVSTDVMKGSAKVTEEEVDVPAGKFKTYKVTMDIESGGIKITNTSWYARNMGPVKINLIIGDKTNVGLELEKFVPGK